MRRYRSAPGGERRHGRRRHRSGVPRAISFLPVDTEGQRRMEPAVGAHIMATADDLQAEVGSASRRRAAAWAAAAYEWSSRAISFLPLDTEDQRRMNQPPELTSRPPPTTCRLRWGFLLCSWSHRPALGWGGAGSMLLSSAPAYTSRDYGGQAGAPVAGPRRQPHALLLGATHGWRRRERKAPPSRRGRCDEASVAVLPISQSLVWRWKEGFDFARVWLYPCHVCLAVFFLQAVFEMLGLRFMGWLLLSKMHASCSLKDKSSQLLIAKLLLYALLSQALALALIMNLRSYLGRSAGGGWQRGASSNDGGRPRTWQVGDDGLDAARELILMEDAV